MSLSSIRTYCLLAGSCDAFTGLMLVAAPLPTLHLMGVDALPGEPVWMRWIGVFVGAVGLCTLWPVLRPSDLPRERLAVTLELTCLVRLAVGLFVVVSVLRRDLDPAFATVAVTDWALAAVQIALLRRPELARSRA